MALINTAKPATTLANAAKAIGYESWDTVTTTWATETRNWQQASSNLSNSYRIEYRVYDVAAIAFAPVTLTGAATSITLADDAVSAGITLPFSFRLFVDFFTTVFISSNGYIGFSPIGMTRYNTSSIPGGVSPSGQIYGYWCDLDPSAGGTIKYETLGTAGSRMFVVQYQNVPLFEVPTDTSTFQIILFEADYHVEVQTTVGKITSTFTKAGQGIESLDGTTAYYLAGRNNAHFNLINDGVSLRYTKNILNINKPT